MTRIYENKKFGLVFLMGMLMFALSGCGGGGNSSIQEYPIDSTVVTTLDRMLSFPLPTSTEATGLAPATPNSPNGGPGLAPTELCRVSEYDALGYGAWTFGAPLPCIQRKKDIMPAGYSNSTPDRNTKLLNFFTITDIHITDEEAPNQLMYLQQFDGPNSGSNTSIYSPVMMYTTQVLDAAMQTVNVSAREKSI